MAISVGAQLTGDDGLLKLRPAVEKVVRRTVSEIEKQFRDYVADSMRAPKHGRFYRRRDRIHRASAPGEAPAIDFGPLLSSLRTEYGSRGLTAKILIGNNSTISYASDLENGVHVRKRPYWKPAIDHIEPIFFNQMRIRLNSLKL